MPEGSIKKEERQYEHIKDSYRDKGVSADEAKEWAARTVNKLKGRRSSSPALRAATPRAAILARYSHRDW